ncbi:hypothetical protein RIF29_26762 [Crotalaria pallida]|uniref:Uncharacterized protein n=1 Tax=Crotalaria pallida TaxID=3830 RepID=A0AAN9HY96_CROPI
MGVVLTTTVDLSLSGVMKNGGGLVKESCSSLSCKERLWAADRAELAAKTGVSPTAHNDSHDSRRSLFSHSI